MRQRNQYESEYIKKLVEYFKKNLKKGYTLESLKWALINQGYSRIAINKAIEQVNKELSQEAPILEEKPKITHEIITEEPKKKPWWKKLFGLD
jgi:hypothetical protein